MAKTVKILEHACSDPEKRKKIESEWTSNEFFDSMFLDNRKTIAAKNKEIARKDKIIQRFSFKNKICLPLKFILFSTIPINFSTMRIVKK